MQIKNGKFIISLDFEITWGVVGAKDLVKYRSNLEAVQQVIPSLLNLFSKHNIHATFATVGFLFFRNKKELMQHLPARQPMYERESLRQYGDHINNLPNEDNGDILHFAPHLIDLIKNTVGQEIGSHTFSHYYCLEKGQTIEDFIADLEAARQTAQQKNIKFESLVFPKNQYNDEYISACIAHGIRSYRGNPESSYHKLRSLENENYFRKALRFADTFINISGHNCYTDQFIGSAFPYNIPASRFLRPYSSTLKLLNGLKLARIKTGMLHAAKTGETYHLWWHPHNFGDHQKENFGFLEKILRYYNILNKKYNFTSYSMKELADSFDNK